MEKLTCEICGSTNIVKHDGVFECQNCGAKYSVEEVKKMMAQDTVPIDSAIFVENYLELAQHNREAGNNEDAESYCNKVLEIDPRNYKAWLIKGEAAGWQSTVIKPRNDESLLAFSKSIAYAPNGEKENITAHVKEQIKSLSAAMIALRGDRFSKWPDEEECSGICAEIESIRNAINSFVLRSGVDVSMPEIMSLIAFHINQSVADAWENVICPELNGDSDDDRPGEAEWQKFIEREGYCSTLLEKAISLCDKDDEDNIPRYKNLIHMEKAAIDSCSWNYNITDYGKSWYKEWGLSDQAKHLRKKSISEYEARIAQIEESIARKKAAEKAAEEKKEKEEAQKRFNEYWHNHAEDRIMLENELTELEAQIASLSVKLSNQILMLNKQTNDNSRRSDIDRLDQTIQIMTKEKASLGLFKGKERKELQAKIDDVMKTKDLLQKKEASFQQEMDKAISLARKQNEEEKAMLQKRIDMIKNELTKSRQ